MPSRPVRALAFAAVAVSLVVGAFTFPQALEPGRSDREGITLVATLGSGDWLPGSSGVQVRPRPQGGLALRTVAGGRLLVTRGLPVDPDACYTALVRARAQTPRVVIALYDESIGELLASETVPPTARPALHDLHFDPAGNARVTFALIGRSAVRASIESLQLVPRQC